MAKIGLKYFVGAKLDESGGTAAYSNGMVIGEAIKADWKPAYENAKMYADDGLAEQYNAFKDGALSLDAKELTSAVRAFLYGHGYTTVTAGGESNVEKIVEGVNDEPPYIGCGFYAQVRRAGVTKYRAIWYRKVKFTPPGETFQTKGETLAFGSTTTEGLAERDVSGEYKDDLTFATEAGARAWLNTLAGLPVTDSAGLSALSMTGAGGTLSPSFGAAVRYYSFGGVTGTSVTVTATAAGHTIKLYVNGVFTQNLTSGVASSGIAMSSIGTKQLRIVAQDGTKTPQTTEIVVIKTA